MAIYGYVRVSSVDQNEDRQMIAMDALNIPIAHIFADKMGGKNFDRPVYKALTKKLRPGEANGNKLVYAMKTEKKMSFNDSAFICRFCTRIEVS